MRIPSKGHGVVVFINILSKFFNTQDKAGY
jgi:hypothetical protein